MRPRRLAISTIAIAIACAGSMSLAWGAEKSARKISLKAVDSWGYQLQNVRSRLVAKDKFDVLVVDYSRDGTEARAFSREAVARMRHRGSEPERIVLAYLSIGEAEAYRYYWQPSWTSAADKTLSSAGLKGFRGAPDGNSIGVKDSNIPLAKVTSVAPPWLAAENPTWRGNHLVRYWDPGWQNIIFGSPSAYLDKIIDAGFDGVYLDKIDSNDDWQATRPTAERDMVEFVKTLAAYARARQRGFLIVPQNAEELLKHKDYLKTIDAIAKEDLLYGGGQRKDGEVNPKSEIQLSKRYLNMALKAGRKVLVVEYLSELNTIVRANLHITASGYVPFFARRALDEPPETVPDGATARGAGPVTE